MNQLIEILHPGLLKLTQFNTPPDDDRLTVKEIRRFNPSLETLDKAKDLTIEELEHLFIDCVGSFEVTHPDYKSPTEELKTRAGGLVELFKKFGEA